MSDRDLTLRDRVAVRLADRLAQSPVRALSSLARRTLRRPRWGNMHRVRPFSEAYGLDRGTPVDRVFIEAFLASNAADVRGRVLEVKDATYTRRFGGDRVRSSDVLDIVETNRRATIIADLGEPGSLPRDSFDCFVMTQTLQCVHDPVWGLRNAWESLRPGGTLLITVPVAAKVEPAYADYWRWTPEGFRNLVDRAVPDAGATIEAHGNFLSLVAYLYGLAAEDLESAVLERGDPEYPVIVSARLTRPEADPPTSP